MSKKTSMKSSRHTKSPSEDVVSRLRIELKRQQIRNKQLEAEVLELKLSYQPQNLIEKSLTKSQLCLYSDIETLRKQLETFKFNSKVQMEQIFRLRTENESIKKLVKSLEQDIQQKKDFGQYLLQQNQSMNKQFFIELAIRENRLRQQFSTNKKLQTKKSINQIKHMIRNFSASTYAR